MKWRTIEGYEGYYEVSDKGDVRSLDRIVPSGKHGTRKIYGRTMKLTQSYGRNNDGYLVVNLRKDHTSKVIPVHRLVAKAFIQNPDNLPTVNHKDGDKTNNKVDNLEWASYSENNIHALDTGLRNPRGNMVAQYDMSKNIVGIYRSACEASRATGIGRGMISHCLNHRANSAGGYIWKKIEKCNDYLGDESTAEDELPLEVQERGISKI